MLPVLPVLQCRRARAPPTKSGSELLDHFQRGVLMPKRGRIFIVAIALAAVGGTLGAQTEELHGAYNFMLEVSGGSAAGYFTECSGLSSEHELPPSTKTPGIQKFANITLKRGYIVTSDLDDWKAKLVQSGLLILTRKDHGRVACRWELRGPRVLGVSGANVRDAAQLSLSATVSGGCN